MLTLLRRSADVWVVCHEAEGFCEVMDADRAIAVMRSFGIEFEQIEAAMTSLIRHRLYAVAEFGLKGEWMFSRPAREYEGEAA